AWLELHGEVEREKPFREDLPAAADRLGPLRTRGRPALEMIPTSGVHRRARVLHETAGVVVQEVVGARHRFHAAELEPGARDDPDLPEPRDDRLEEILVPSRPA